MSIRFAIIIALTALSSGIDIAAQQTELRWRRRPIQQGANTAPTVQITVPTQSSTYITSAAGITLEGTAADNEGPVSTVTWSNNQGGSGNAAVTGTSWSIPYTAGNVLRFDAPFTYVGNIDVASYTPATGTSFTEDIDTVGTNHMRLYGGGGYVLPNPLAGSIVGERLAYYATTAVGITSGNYSVEAKFELQGANDHWVLRFGRADASNYCVLIVREASNAIDFEIGKYVSGTYSTIGSGVNAGPVNGQTAKVVLNGTSLKGYINDVEKLSVTDSFCDDATGTTITGFGAGAFGGGTGRLNVVTFDNFKVNDLAGGGSGITLASGLVNRITVTATDTGGLTGTAIIDITHQVADTTAPIISIEGPTSAATYTTPTAAFTLSGVAADGGGFGATPITISCSPSCASIGSVTWTAGTGAWSVLVTVNTGTTNVTARATDSATNFAEDTLAVTYSTTDVTAPVVTITTNGGTDFSTGTTPTTLSGTCSDASGVCTITVTSNNCGNGTVTGSLNWSAVVNLVPGACLITVTGRDASNNAGTDTITVTYTGGQTLTIVTTAVSNWTNGVTATRTLTATGGTPPYTWDNNSGGSSLSGYGAVCAGGSGTITTSSSQGVITMTTPSTNGNCTATIRVTDNAAATDTQDIVITVAAAGSTRHSYFETLRARADCYRAWSLRPSAGSTTYADNCSTPHYVNTLKRTGLGGWSDASVCNDEDEFKYLYPSDQFAEGVNIDAMKVIVAPFSKALLGCEGTSAIDGAINDTVTRIVMAVGTSPSLYDKPGSSTILVDSEKMLITDCAEAGFSAYIQATRELCVTRGSYGTAAASHSSGALTRLSINSAQYHLSLPIGRPSQGVVGTEDNHRYFITWDSWWSSRYMNPNVRTILTNYKWINTLTNGASRDFWETQTFFNPGSYAQGGFSTATNVFMATARAYQAGLNGAADWTLTDGWTACSVANCAANGITQFDPVLPYAGFVNTRPGVWIRHFLLIDQKANDYDPVSYWVADETTTAVKIYDARYVSIKPKPGNLPGSVDVLWIQVNTSTDRYRLSDDDLIHYISNAIVIKDPDASEYATPGSGLLLNPVP